MKYAASLLTLLLALGCTRSGDNATTGGNVSIILASSTLARARAGSACTVTPDTGAQNGTCYTPLSVSGIFNSAYLSKTAGSVPARILGGGTTSGLAGIFKKTVFDLKTSPDIPSSDDNLQSATGSYDIVTLTIQSLDVTFLAEATNKVYHVRIPFTNTPPSLTPSFSTCGLGDALAEADSLGTLYGTVQAYAGDVLVCIKATETETCADTDYQWVDGSGNLSATRPASPKALSGTYLKTDDACASGAERPEITWGYANMDILLGTAVEVTAAFGDGGVKTYTSGATSGTKLTVTLDIDTTNSLFVPNSAFATDLSATSQANILAQIDKVLLKPIYLKNANSTPSPGTGDMTATATLAITE